MKPPNRIAHPAHTRSRWRPIDVFRSLHVFLLPGTSNWGRSAGTLEPSINLPVELGAFPQRNGQAQPTVR
jgi:hypothetical protein